MKDPTTTPTLEMDHQRLTRPATLVWVTGFGVLIYLVLGFGLRPDAWVWPAEAGLGLALQIALELLGVNLLAVVVTLALIRWRAGWSKPYVLRLDGAGLAGYAIAMLLMVPLAILLFLPLTESLRYLLRGEWVGSWQAFWSVYGYCWSTFLVYLGGLLPAVMLALAWNLLRQWPDRSEPVEVQDHTPQRLLARGPGGRYSLEPADIHWVYMDGRRRVLMTDHGPLVCQLSLTEIGKRLGRSAFQISRSEIVSRQVIRTFSSLGNGETLIRLNAPFDEELVVSRRRGAGFKAFMLNGGK